MVFLFVCWSEQERVVVDEDGGQGGCVGEGAIQVLLSKFHFVDLAGSERVGRTGNYGERFKGIHAVHKKTKVWRIFGVEIFFVYL